MDTLVEQTMTEIEPYDNTSFITIAALQCVYTGERPVDPCFTKGLVYPIQEAAEYDALTGQQAFRWVRIYDDNGTLRLLERNADGTYFNYLVRSGLPRVFKLTIG